MRLRESWFAARGTKRAVLGMALLLIGATAGADDPSMSDNLKLQAEVADRIAALREETQLLRTVLEKRTAELEHLEEVESQLVISAFREKMERRYKENEKKRQLEEKEKLEKFRKALDPDFMIKKL